MPDSPRSQKLMLVVALLGFTGAALITYNRNANDNETPSSLDGDIYPAAAAKPGDDAYNPKTVVRPFKPIKDARFIKASEVKNQVADNELVLAIEIEGEARAYPINMLCGPQREIINDTLGNRAIAATW